MSLIWRFLDHFRSTAVQEYHYRPLRTDVTEIRLIELLPGEFNDEIRITISHARLDSFRESKISRPPLSDLQASLPDKWVAYETLDGHVFFLDRTQARLRTSWTHPDPDFDLSSYRLPDYEDEREQESYEALSYAWRDQSSDRAVILVQGHERDVSTSISRLQITKELETALRWLRSDSDMRLLWIDQISINQLNNSEKRHQIPLMAKIYKRASRVIAWIGADEAESYHTAIKALVYLYERIILGKSLIFLRPGFTDYDWNHLATHLPYDDGTWLALQAFFERPWFQRLWVWQEIRMSSRHAILQTRSDAISWQSLYAAVHVLHSTNAAPRPVEMALEKVMGLQTDLQMMQMLWKMGISRTSEPRDKVYGTLALWPSFARSITIDYQLPIGEVYKQFFLALVGHHRRLDHLCLCSVDSARADAPTWVGDLENLKFTESCSYLIAGGYSASRARLIDETQLEVAAVFCGTIVSTSDCMTEDLDEVFQACADFAGDAILENDSRLTALAASFIAGQYSSRCTSFNWFDLEGIKAALRARGVATLPPGLVRLFGAWKIGRYIKDKMLVRLEDGTIGVATSSCVKGDVVGVVFGCSQPIVLRPVAPNLYAVNGSVSFHHLQDGNALLGPLPNGWRLQLWYSGNYSKIHFANEHGHTTPDDPRLRALSEEWEREEERWTLGDPQYAIFYRHKTTGERINYDPRMTAEEIEARGVAVQDIFLV